MIRYFFLFSLCLLSFAGHNQVNQQYIFHHLGLREGLLSDEINASVQDAKGYIWIAGKNGLQRYDGYRFVDFRHRDDDSNSLPHNNITHLAIDKKNRLWLLTANYKLGYFDVNKFLFHEVHVEFNGKLLDKAEGDLKPDLQKNILLVLRNYGDAAYGVMGYDEQRNVFTASDRRFKVPVDWHVEYFSIDSIKGNFWLGTKKGLIKFDPHTGKYSYRGHNEDNDPIINALQDYTMIENVLLDREGNCWMNIANTERKTPHLIKYNSNENKVYDYYNEINEQRKNSFSNINSLVQFGNGPVWVTGRSIFVRIAGKLDFIFSDMPGQFSIHYDEVRNLNFDRENNCWISTNNGLYRMNASAAMFNYVSNRKYNDDSVYTSDVVDFLHLPNGNILTASWGNGLFEYDNHFNPVKSEIADQGDSKGEKLVWALLRRSNGDIWSPHQDGYLYIYHAATHTTEKIHDPIFENNTIRQIAEDRNGNIWLGTKGWAIIKWDKTTNTFKLATRINASVFRLYADKNGDIWAIADVVTKLDINNGAIAAQYSTGAADGKHLLAGDIVDMLQFNDSTYIIASQGLNILNKRTGLITYYTTSNGLPSDYISNIILDKKGLLWVSTENGICSINFQKKHRSSYNIEDGIYNSGFTPTSSTLLNDGRIVLGTNHNIMVFDPDKMYNNDLPKPKVEITGISIMNEAQLVDSLLQFDKVALGYAQNSMIIQFSSLTYKDNFNVVYQMERLDKNWINANGRTEAVYSYLPPGDYTFKVGIPDARGKVTNFTSINFTISAPFWRSWTFYLALALLAGIIVWRINRERIKRIKDVLQMRNNIGRELHKEVSTALKNISVLSEIAAMKADVNLKQSKDYIQEIKLKSRSTVIAMDDVMWSIDPANDSMLKIIERIHEIAGAVGNEYNTKVEVDISDKVQQYDLSMKERLELMLIYKKAILMLGKEMQAAHITVSLEKEKDDLVLKLVAEGDEVNRSDKKIAKDLEEIKNRAAAIQCVIDMQQGATYTAFIAVIKHR